MWNFNYIWSSWLFMCSLFCCTVDLFSGSSIWFLSFCWVDFNELWVLKEAAIQNFLLTSLTAMAGWFHFAALTNFSKKIREEDYYIIIVISPFLQNTSLYYFKRNTALCCSSIFNWLWRQCVSLHPVTFTVMTLKNVFSKVLSTFYLKSLGICLE